MDLTALTEDQFLCGATPHGDASAFGFDDLAIAISPFLGASIRALRDGYSLNASTDDPGNVFLLHNGEIVGFYWTETLLIADAHTGKALSIPLILEAVKARPLPASRKVTHAGHKALRKAWRVANGKEFNPWL
ncbi:MAG: hypothetical protein KF779_10400 [Hyphomonadaceae bacterium]|nr:hypothetical protein [Hyphomonadaceae bacterium]